MLTKTTICSLLIGATMTLQAAGRQGLQGVQTMSPAELIEGLKSQDSSAAEASAAEIFSRGAALVPFLVELKGDRAPFSAAPWLVRPSASQLLIPEEVTIEVAALYLNNAIYRNRLRPSQSPYLTDLRLPRGRRKAENSGALIERAWRSTEKWVKLLQTHGIDWLRLQKIGPLDDGQVDFW